MKKIILIVLGVFGGIIMQGQQPSFLWGSGIGSGQSDMGNSVFVDIYGNIYSTGFFQDTVDFDSGLGVNKIISFGGKDIFVSKLDKFGNLLWAKNMGGNGDDVGNSIVVDSFGNAYVTGYFNDIANFNPLTDKEYYLNSKGKRDIFISKLDSNGNFVWAKSMGDTSNDAGISIDMDKYGNIYTTGYFFNNVDFDPNIGIYNIASAGSSDIFISKLDSAGNYIFAKSFSGIYDQTGLSIKIDKNCNIYTTGFFDGSVDFDPNNNSYFLNSIGIYDLFVTKLDSTGNFIWANHIGSISSYTMGISISIDFRSNLLLTGRFDHTTDFDPSANSNLLYIWNGNGGVDDVFILKLDSTGNFIWAKSIGGWSYDIGTSITTDFQGNIYTTGYYSGVCDFNPNTGFYNLTSNANFNDIFISKLDSSGNFLWAKSIGGVENDEGHSICVNNTGEIFVSGYFSNVTDFDPNIGIFNSTSNGYEDIFILKMYECNINNSFSQNGTTLSATATGATYQWITCNPFTIINGATNQTYTATANGDYAVIISQNGCTDTSNCMTVNSVGINVLNTKNLITISPNPTNSIFKIECPMKEGNVILYNSFGQKLLTTKIENYTSKINISQYSKGIYIAEIIDEKTSYRVKIIKE